MSDDAELYMDMRQPWFRHDLEMREARMYDYSDNCEENEDEGKKDEEEKKR